MRIAATRPSIMSEGATTSAPARTSERAVLASSGSVASLSTSPSRMTPQCPCEVYSSKQTSVTTSISGTSRLTRPTVSCTAAASSQASLPVSSFFSGIPNRMRAGIPSEKSSRASATAESGDSRKTPGSEEISSRSAFPRRTKSGAMNRSGERRVSRTSAREAGLRRRRRRRSVGKLGIEKNLCPGGRARKRFEQRDRLGEPRLLRHFDARDAMGFQKTAREPPQDDGRRRAQALCRALDQAGEEPPRRRGRRGAEGGEGPLDDLVLQSRISRPGNLAVEDEAHRMRSSGAKPLGQFRGRILAAREQHAPPRQVVGQALEHALRGTSRDDIRLDSLRVESLARGRAHGDDASARDRLLEKKSEPRVPEEPLDSDLAREDREARRRFELARIRLHRFDRMADLFDDLNARGSGQREKRVRSGTHHEGPRKTHPRASSISDAAPRERSRSAAALPMREASSDGPAVSSRRTVRPSGEKTAAVSVSEPSRTRASPATGALHPDSSTARRLRSASTSRWEPASSSEPRKETVAGSFSRAKIASAPCPTAGSRREVGRTSEISSSRPSRASPARARTMAS